MKLRHTRQARSARPLSLLALLFLSCHASGPPQTARPEGTATAHFPRFSRELLLETTAEASANVSIGDLDGDGNLDLMLAKGRHWPLVDRVLLGDGKDQFPRQHDLGAASDRSYSGRLADLDGDGDLDVVISNDRPDPKRIYLNDGSGHFALGSTFGEKDWPTRNAAVADLNGDGLADIVVANRTGGTGANHICLNQGGARFDGGCFAFSRESATTITPADLNGDGHTDLVVPNRDGGQSYVYLHQGNAGQPTFGRLGFGPPKASYRMAETADFDGDGRVDLVVSDEREGVSLFFGEADGGYSAGLSISGGTSIPYALAVGDLNLDGAVDVVIGYVEEKPVVLFNDGTGRAFFSVSFGDQRGVAYGFAIGDLDGDGFPDIAVARSDAPNAVYFGVAAR